MFSIKLVVVDMKQGGNMTYFHVPTKLVVVDMKQGGNMTYLHVSNQFG